jgi:hypothetical protein
MELTNVYLGKAMLPDGEEDQKRGSENFGDSVMKEKNKRKFRDSFMKEKNKRKFKMMKTHAQRVWIYVKQVHLI